MELERYPPPSSPPPPHDADVAGRAALHRALGDERRLRIVDALRLSDRSPSELAALTGLSTNLLAFHLDVLEAAGVIVRSTSQGDGRRRYVSLDPGPLARLGEPRPLDQPVEVVVFVCTANSARSQLAAQLWHRRTGHRGWCAGTAPADRVHPLAVEVARRHGLDLSDAVPVAYRDLGVDPDLVVSVCDRAREDHLAGFDAPWLHWSIPDPADGDDAAFEDVFHDLAGRVDRLAGAAAASSPTPGYRSPPEDDRGTP